MVRDMSKSLAKAIMKIWPNHPKEDSLNLQEIFNHDSYTQAPIEKQHRIKLQSSQFRYEYEKQNYCLFEKYFPSLSPDDFHNKSILDLGSFTGGRLVYWVERYGFGEARGIDVDPVYAEAASLFAESKGVNASFDTGFGESLPYDSNHFDFIVSYDVFEHVQNIEQVMQECYRVLKPGGKLLAIFPGFYQPLESHLGLATKMPALQWLFSGKTLTAAYVEVLSERGTESSWYARKDPNLAQWEKLPCLNGITVAGFRRLVKAQKGWNALYWGRNTILSHGRQSKKIVFRLLAYLLALPARLPILEELFLGRICCMLEKRRNGTPKK